MHTYIHIHIHDTHKNIFMPSIDNCVTKITGCGKIHNYTNTLNCFSVK